MEVLKIKNLSKDFGGVKALQNISLSVERGEHRALIGPNGAGKSTLLSIRNGELKPTTGKLYILDRDVTTMPSHQRVHLGVARACQIINLFLNLSVLENVLLALQAVQPFCFNLFQPVSKYDDILLNEAQQLLVPRGLWEKRDIPVSVLSYGEQRQMEFILCLASKPQLLLLDEPTSGLTAGETSKMVELIRDLGRDISVLIVAHNIDVVFAIADRITVLSQGLLVAEGTPDEIKNNPKAQQVYLGVEREGTDATAS